MVVTLVTFSPKGVRKDFPLESGSLLIGRKTEADLRIPLQEISREHCRISVNGRKVVLHDLDSGNGTFVNEQRIVQATLKAGDRIKIGPVVFTVQIDGLPKKISPPAPPSPPARHASADAPTEVSPTRVPSAKAPASSTKAPPSGEEEIDLDNLEELDLDDVSDFDLDDLDVDEDEGAEVIEDAEIIEDDDLADDDSDVDPKK
jgi:predicted component of type VI protein secretion system